MGAQGQGLRSEIAGQGMELRSEMGELRDGISRRFAQLDARMDRGFTWLALTLSASSRGDTTLDRSGAHVKWYALAPTAPDDVA